MLNIPIGEVHLHRQVANAFAALIGPEIQLAKKQAEAETGTELLLSLARQQKVTIYVILKLISLYGLLKANICRNMISIFDIL